MTQFTLFGQAVLMVLIQIGGLSFMTVSILVALLLHRRIGLHRRSVLMDSVGALQMGGVVRLTRRALLVTAACEGTGAVMLALWFCPRYGVSRGCGWDCSTRCPLSATRDSICWEAAHRWSPLPGSPCPTL